VHWAAWWVKFLKVSLIEIEAVFIRPARPRCTIVEDDAEISELAAALFSREALAVRPPHRYNRGSLASFS